MTAKNWKTNLNVDTLLESKVATRWSVVKSWSLDGAIVLQCVVAQRRMGRGLSKVQSGYIFSKDVKTWSVAASNKTAMSWNRESETLGARQKSVAVVAVVCFMKSWNHELSWNFAASRQLRCNGAQVCCELSKIKKSQSFVWVSTLRGCGGEFGHRLFLLTEGVANVTTVCFMKTWPSWKSEFEGGCVAWKQSCNSTKRGKIMKAGRCEHSNAWQRKGVWVVGSKNAVAVANCASAMRSSAKAFGSRALKRPSRLLQFFMKTWSVAATKNQRWRSKESETMSSR